MNGGVPLARTLAEFVVEVPMSRLTTDHRRTVNQAFLDTVGVLLAGSRHPLGQVLLAEAHARGGNPQATVFGLATRTSCVEAAYVHGSMAHTLDFDDTAGYGHPSGTLLAALLAAAECTGRPVRGVEVVLAYCVGFEVASALRAASDYAQEERGFHSTGLFGGMAATAATARLLGLNVDQTTAAFGIAASGIGGLVANFGTMTKPLHMGSAARNGLRAALLARAGLDASAEVFEASDGYCATFLGRGTYRLAEVTGRLDGTFRVASGRMTKKYPCCGSSHSAVDALLEGMRAHGLRYDDIASVEVHDVSPSTPVVRFLRPDNGMQARFSLPYALAAAMRDGTVRDERFTDEAVIDPVMRAAIDKVRVAIAPRGVHLPREADASGHSGANLRAAEANPVVIRVRDGRVVQQAVSRGEMLGGPANPLPRPALEQKFRDNARLPAESVDELVAAWLGLDQATEVARLVELTARAVLSTEGSGAAIGAGPQ